MSQIIGPDGQAIVSEENQLTMSLYEGGFEFPILGTDRDELWKASYVQMVDRTTGQAVGAPKPPPPNPLLNLLLVEVDAALTDILDNMEADIKEVYQDRIEKLEARLAELEAK